MSIPDDPLAGIIADAVTSAPQSGSRIHVTSLQDHFRGPHTPQQMLDREAHIACGYFGHTQQDQRVESDNWNSVQAKIAVEQASVPYQKFDAAHATYTFETQADTQDTFEPVDLNTEPWTAREYSEFYDELEDLYSPRIPSTPCKPKTLYTPRTPTTPAASDGLGFFGEIPRSVDGVLAEMKEKTGFSIKRDTSKSNIDTNKLMSSDYRDRYLTSSPNITSRFPTIGEGRVIAAPGTPRAGTGFTPLIEQTEHFARQQNTFVLESPTAKRWARKERKNQHVATVVTPKVPQPKRTVGTQKKKVVLSTSSEEQARFLSANIPDNPEYEFDIILNGISIVSKPGFSQEATATRAPAPEDVGQVLPTTLISQIEDANPYFWTSTFEDLAQLMHPDFDNTTASDSGETANPRPQPKIGILLGTSAASTLASPQTLLSTVETGFGPLGDFYLFPKLPAELQLMIWEFAVPGQRSVQIEVPSKETKVFTPHLCPIPGVLTACRIARSIGLKTLVPAFQSLDSPHQYTYFNGAIDVLQMTLKSAKHLAQIKDEPSVTATRALVRHMRIPYEITHGFPMYLAIAELVLAAPLKAWPSIQTWHFPDLRTDKTVIKRKRSIKLYVKRPTRLADHEDEKKVRALATRVENAFDQLKKNYSKAFPGKESEVQFGLRFEYN